MSEYWVDDEKCSCERIRESEASLAAALSSKSFVGFSNLYASACVLRLILTLDLD